MQLALAAAEAAARLDLPRCGRARRAQPICRAGGCRARAASTHDLHARLDDLELVQGAVEAARCEEVPAVACEAARPYARRRLDLRERDARTGAEDADVLAHRDHHERAVILLAGCLATRLRGRHAAHKRGLCRLVGDEWERRPRVLEHGPRRRERHSDLPPVPAHAGDARECTDALHGRQVVHDLREQVHVMKDDSDAGGGGGST